MADDFDHDASRSEAARRMELVDLATAVQVMDAKNIQELLEWVRIGWAPAWEGTGWVRIGRLKRGGKPEWQFSPRFRRGRLEAAKAELDRKRAAVLGGKA